MIFQADLFDVLHEYAGGSAGETLHLVSENPAERNSLYTARRLHLDTTCNTPLIQRLLKARILRRTDGGGLAGHPLDRTDAGRQLRARATVGPPVVVDPPGVNSSVFWNLFGATHRLNFGSMFGTTAAVITLCEQVVDALVGPLATCWDQGILNVLVWTGLLDLQGMASTNHPASGKPSIAAARIFIWDCFEGPIKTLDVGGVRDARGRFYNERGAEYALVHQFRPTRQKAFVAELGMIFPPRSPGATTATPSSADDAAYPKASWQHTCYTNPLQRAPFVWDDKRRMLKLKAQHALTATPNPSDPARPLPELLQRCAPVGKRFAPCAHRDKRGRVHGDAWEAFDRAGFVRAEG